MKRFIQMEHIHALCMLAFALVLGAGAASAQTIAPMVTNFDYSNYTFTYTEGGQTKTAKLTDEATTPDHSIALLKAVYTDKTIPGTLWGYNYNGTQIRQLNYANYAKQGTPWTMGTVNATTYPNPEQKGMTLLLVQMKEGWTSKTSTSDNSDYIKKAYSSVKLITNFTRVHDPNNPGYLFSIDGATNRFFFIAKGKPRYTQTRPLYRLFEQISPVNTNAGSAATYEFIAKMRSGETYLCYHDCSDVGTIDAGHWFTLSQEGEAYSLKNLTIFVPDRRFEHNRVDQNNEQYFCYYGNSQNPNQTQYPDEMPKVLMYTATLEANASPSQTTGYYRVDLDWNTSFTHDKIGADVPEHFYVYILNADNTRTLIEEVTKDANGLVVTKHHDYLVQQTTDQQTINYVVTAQTINYDNDGNIIMGSDGKPMTTLQAETPVRSVIIPGYSPFFTQASEFRSRFDIPNQVNIYKNKMSIRPTTSNDFYAIKNNQEEYEVTRTDANGVKVTVAWVQFTQQEGQTGYNYTVRYNEDTQVTDLVFDDEQPTTSGTITDFIGSTVYIIDRFTASTQTNEQPNEYTYQFEQNEGKYSNTLPVPVYKTTNEVNGSGYSLEEIKTDTDHSLRAAPCNEITYHAIYDPAANLAEYDVIRLDNAYNEFKVSKADHLNNSGEYHVFAVGPDGNLNEPVYDPQPKFGTDGGDITVPDKNASVADEVSRYVPVIITLYGGDQFKRNTYGCDIKQMSYPQLKVETVELMKTEPYAGATCWVRSYEAELKLTPILPADVKNVYYYRVWRVMNGQTILPVETLLNTQTDISGTTGNISWGSDLASIKQIYPGSAPITITDLYTDAASSKKVTYIVRLYSTNVDGEPEGDPIDVPRSAKSRTTIDGKDYYITEQKIVVDYDAESVITGIEQLAHDSEIESVIYYNFLGIPSAVPYSGINLMSVRYRDGRTVTSKVVR